MTDANPKYEAVETPTKATIVQVEPADTTATSEPATQPLKILLFFLLWFVLSVGYNIFNKKAVNKISLPWIIATSQILAGIPIFGTLWLTGVRARPTISWPDLKILLPLAVFHCFAHMCACLAMHAGSVSFAHIIKSAEPITTAILSILLLREILNWKVYVALLPVIAGVSMASISEPAFSWLAFITAMAANIFSSLRGVYSKRTMTEPIGQNVDARNLYGLITVFSFLILAPLALIIEGPKMVQVWHRAEQDGVDIGAFCLHAVLSGFCYYTYNEVAFSTLELVSPVTHAVGSTFKRIFIIGSSIIIFGNYPNVVGYIGMSVAILGVGVYSFAKQKYKTAPAPLIQKQVDTNNLS